MAKGDYETAKDEFLNTLNAARDEYGAEAKYLLAEIFYLNKEYAQCKETVISLNNDFAAYEIWVGKAFLLLADNSLAQDGDAFQAKATLESLIEHFPLQSIKDQAKAKLAEIEKANLKKEAEIKADTLDNNR
jgi:TolA-binding protein